MDELPNAIFVSVCYPEVQKFILEEVTFFNCFFFISYLFLFYLNYLFQLVKTNR